MNKKTTVKSNTSSSPRPSKTAEIGFSVLHVKISLAYYTLNVLLQVMSCHTPMLKQAALTNTYKIFPLGTCGKSIRTDTGWVTPVDFVKDASCQTDVSWKKHIKCEGKPLGDLINVTVTNHVCKSLLIFEMY